MNYTINTEKGVDTVSYNQLQSTHTLENREADNIFTSLTKGQRISGVVSKVGNQITLNFEGKEFEFPKAMLPDAFVGETKIFEVKKVTNQNIQLKELGKSFTESNNAIIVGTKVDTQRTTFFNQKEHTNKQVEQDKEYQDTKNKLGEIVAKMTEQDYMKLEAEGFSVADFTTDRLYSALHRVKTEKIYTVEGQVQQSKSERSITNAVTEKEISTRLTEANLPTSKETVQKVVAALELSKSVTEISEKSVKYLIDNKLAPTIENIYKAQHSANNQSKGKAYEISDETWEQLQPQVETVIVAAGYDMNQENLSKSRWLIENELPLTRESLTYVKELEEIKTHTTQDVVIDKVIEGMKKGIAPKDISLEVEDVKSSERLVADLNQISDEAIIRASEDHKELTLEKLIDTQKEISLSPTKGPKEKVEIKTLDSETMKEETENISIEAIKAKRQVEEIRLRMTVEASQKLATKGLHIETEQLEKVVEALKEMENSYYQELLGEAELAPNEEQLQVLKDTTQSVERLKYAPCYILGLTLSERNIQTVSGLLESGTQMQAELLKANEAYETLMTVPNREYGDSIQKAFKNADSMLNGMDMENSPENQRAVRILGYNSMEITKENINQVKVYDLQVTTLIKNLRPAVTTQLIKNGTNPLNIPISELNKTITQIKEEQGDTAEEKYSTYLRKLDKEKGITVEERKAFVGIYRLLNNVEKTDGAALGAVIKADQEVTLKNLLTAVRTQKNGSMNTIVNDDFGSLQSLIFKRETITEQLSAVFKERETIAKSLQQEEPARVDQPVENNNETTQNTYEAKNIKEQVEYFNTMLGKIMEEITPSKLTNVFAPLLSSDKGVWEQVNQIPMEKLYSQLQEVTEDATIKSEEYTQKMQELRETVKNSDQAIKFLNDFKVPSSATNMMIASHILSDGGSLFKKLNKLKSENEEKNTEKSLMKMAELSDTLIDKTSMKKAYEELGNEVEDVLNTAYENEQIDFKKLAELKSISTQMIFAKTLANKEHYQIPIETENGITNINLTVIHGTANTGKVSVSIYSENLGNIKADMTVKSNTLKGFICCDNRNGLETIQNRALSFEKVLNEDGISVKQMDFSMGHNVNEIYTYQNPERESDDIALQSDTEKVLYRVAKACVLMVQAAEREVSQE